MATLQSNYDAIAGKINADRAAEISGLTQLQQSYVKLIGKEDPTITGKLADTNTKYDSKISRLSDQFGRFNSMMKLSDEKIRVNNSNERLNLTADDWYSKNPLLEQILGRSLNEDGFWNSVFPIKESNPTRSELLKKITPTLFNPQIMSLQEKYSANNSEVEQDVKAAIQTVEKHVGNTYNLLKLTQSELFRLASGLEEYVNGASDAKWEGLIDWVHSCKTSETFCGLSRNEQNKINYALKKEGQNGSGDHGKLREDVGKSLIGIIFKCHGKMIDQNDKFRNTYVTEDLLDSFDPTAIFYVEKFLTQHVRAERLPAYSDAARRNLNSVLELDDQIKKVLSEPRFGGLHLYNTPKTMKDLWQSVKNRPVLTEKQVSYIGKLTNNYISKIQFAESSFSTEELQQILNSQKNILPN